MPIPPFADGENLPPGVHRAKLGEVLGRFGAGSIQRLAIASRLLRIERLARSTGHLARFVLFGSFVTSKPAPNDIDVFLLMDDNFDVDLLTGEASILFDHPGAQSHFGASVFWMRRLAAFGGEQAAVEFWQTRRDGGPRGIIEILLESP